MNTGIQIAMDPLSTCTRGEAESERKVHWKGQVGCMMARGCG